MQIASYIDHTLLKSATSIAEIEQLCKEAAEYGFAAVCIPPPYVKRCKNILAPTRVRVATVIGFPFGYAPTESKMAETVLALVDQADELDMVINLIALRMNDWRYLENEVKLLTDIVHQKNKIIKVIIESGILRREEIIQCCETFSRLNIDFIKTSTGYAEKGASIEAVQLIKETLPTGIRIKASGGIKTYQFAKQLIDAGAQRLGCSASVAIMKEEGATEFK